MLAFDNLHINDLKEYLYYSYIHDAKIEALSYDKNKKSLTISIVNSIYDNQIKIIFENVKIILSLNGNEIGSCEQILSLSIEEDYSFLKSFPSVCQHCFFDNIYLLFQMFSGDELHIVSEKVLIDDNIGRQGTVL